jgi:hypothetical protein
MSLTVAVPAHPLFRPLVERAEEACRALGFTLRVGTEQECALWLASNAAEVALITPLGYAAESFKTDYRILPGPALALDGLTYTASLYLKPQTQLLARCGSFAADDFLMKVGTCIVSEKFDIDLELSPLNTCQTIQEAFEYCHVDVVADYGFDVKQAIVLDISDEWTDYTQTVLPVAFWVCRPNEVPETLPEALYAMARQYLPEQEVVHEQIVDGANAGRTGRLLWQWNDEIEAALQKTIELLYYWQFVEVIAAIKLWQRDSAHPLAS